MWASTSSNGPSTPSHHSPKSNQVPSFRFSPSSPSSASSSSSPHQPRLLSTPSSHHRTPSWTLSAFLYNLRYPVSFRPRQRRAISWILAILIAAYLLFAPATNDSDTSDRIADFRCRFLPWSGGCLEKDPFAKLEYEVKKGHLYYPARLRSRSSSSPARVTESSTVHTEQPHPIHILLRTAERDWEAKVARQSKTLREACAEYRRRYGRAPPKGFDKWYNFSVKNNVPLVDEYDAIDRRILLFYSLPPNVLRKRSDMLQNDEDFWMHAMTATIEIRNEGRDVNVTGPMKKFNKRPEQVLKLLDGISQYLPDLNVTITGHDNPWITVSGQSKERHIAAAKAGKYIEEADLENYYDDGSLEGWATICPPSSALAKASSFESRKNWKPPKKQSFIVDHLEAMDVCEHPEWQGLHGTTSWPGPRPGLLFPMFTFTTDTLHDDLLLPPLEQWEYPVGNDPSWKDKKFDKVVWRGSTTGSDLTLEQARKWSQRVRLNKLYRQPGHVSLQLSLNDKPDKVGPATPYSESARALAAEYFDFHFMGAAKQCGDEDSCADFEDEFDWEEHMTFDKQNEYKYVIDVDGNGWSGRFHRLMSSNNVVLKSTIFPEWYSERIQPWYHYVPIGIDFQDLWNVMVFFKGNLDGRGEHDAEAEKIGKQGQKWAEETWRWVDMQTYMLRLLLEYARLVLRDEADPHSMDFDDSKL